jgi:hypothetical protein
MSIPTNNRSSTTSPEAADAPVLHRENLEGWIPSLAGVAETREALERAFDYRGDVTITLRNGDKLEGYVFDRRSAGPELRDCSIRLLPRVGKEKIAVTYDQIARLEFTGRDTAAGKSWETWTKKYAAKKAAGETNIRLDPEPLDSSEKCE